jgi:hypothetical protein
MPSKIFAGQDMALPDYWNLKIHSVAVRTIKPQIERVLLHELHKTEISGKKSGERLTLYKMTVMKVQSYLAGKDWTLVNDLLIDLKDDMYWADPKSGIRNMCSVWEVDKFDTQYIDRKLCVKNKG